MPPAGGNRSAGNSGGGNGPQFVGGTPGSFPTSSPDRSANGDRPGSFSDPIPKEQSEGHRPSLCGFIRDVYHATVSAVGKTVQAHHNLKEFLNDAQAFAKHPTNPAHFLRNGYETLRQGLGDDQPHFNRGMDFLTRQLNVSERDIAMMFSIH